MAVKFLTGIDCQDQRARAFASPSAGTDGANKDYVDARVAGLTWKEAVRAASTADVDISQLNNGDALDGVTVATNDRVLLKNQTAGAENGIYVVGATAGTTVRATDADSTAELHNATVFSREGTVNADTAWVQTATVTTVDTTAQVWAQFGAGGTPYTADGEGIELSSNEFSLELDGATLAKSASGLKVNDAYAGAGLTVSSDVLAVNPGTGLEISSDAVRIATSAAGAGLTGGGGSALAVDTAVVARKFSASIGDGSTTAIAVTHNLGTKDVIVQLRLNSDDSHIFADVVSTSTTQVTITFAVAPASSAVRVTVIG